MTERFDVIVIGAGAAGLSSAWRLSSYGFKVCCFEQGTFLKSRDLIPISEGGELQKFSKLSFDPNIRKSKSDFHIDSSESPIHLANYNGVGGSTILFSAQYPRFHESDFKVYSQDKVGSDWPIDYKDIQKYYEIDQQITGVSGLEGDRFYKEIKNLMPPVPLGPMGKKISNGFKKLGWHHWPAYSAINTIPYNSRPADNYIRPSNMGDSTGAKGATDKTYLPLALKNGLILKTNCQVVNLESSLKRINSIKYIDSNNKPQTATAKFFILAASGIGTPRLLLHSKSPIHPKGIANSSGLVGKNLMLHPLGYVEGYFSENISSSLGPQGCCLLSQEFYQTKNENDFKRGYTMQVLRGPLPVEASLNLISRKLIKLGSKTFIKDFLSYFDHSAHISIITEDLPDVKNKIELDYKFKNKFGMPGVKVKYSLSENSKRMISHGLTNGRKLLRSSGAKKTFAFGPVRNTGWHILGTCKMGDDPKNSVVDKFGKCHDFENLYISDASIFSSSGGVNPASTICALSLYIADCIFQNLKKN